MKKIIPFLVISLAACNGNEPNEVKSDGSGKEVENTEEKHDEHEHHHGHGEANEYMHGHTFDDLVANFESQDRIDYQQPDKVLDFLGNLKGKKVMDIGAGTGFFSFRLAKRGAMVIAADVNEDFQNYIQNKRDSLNIGDDKISLRKLPYDSPELKNEEVDMVIIVNTYHHIENRREYFQKVKSGLKKDGRLVIIDYKKEELPVGPPLKMKLSPEEVISELKDAGFETSRLNEDMLEYQYIIELK